jgi:hypothetical protein
MAPISDEEWADLVAHELPKTSDPVIQNYLKSRRALMAEDLIQRSGISFPPFIKHHHPLFYSVCSAGATATNTTGQTIPSARPCRPSPTKHAT